jgi:5-methyltetrahydropteroyltriglutamate--homocysteine methyltransferase
MDLMRRVKPPFRAEQVGSLLRPPELREAQASFSRNEISEAQFRSVQDQAIAKAVLVQEDLGLQVVTDGEFRRASWFLDFVCQFANVHLTKPRLSVRFHTVKGDIEFAPPTVQIVGKLGRPHPIVARDFAYLKSIAKVTPKQTIPSPTMLHFRGGRDAIDAGAYPDLAEFYDDLARLYADEIADLAKAGCRYLQIDETNLAYLCDPLLRQEVQSKINEDPVTLLHTYAKLINQAIGSRPSDMVVGMHLCRGNNQSAWVAEGGYEPVAEALFNEIGVDSYFLEYDSERAGDFTPLRFVPKGKIVVLGLVTTKNERMETKDALKRRIEEASRYVPLDQLALSPQCGFSSTDVGNDISYQGQLAKLNLVVEVANEVWG